MSNSASRALCDSRAFPLSLSVCHDLPFSFFLFFLDWEETLDPVASLTPSSQKMFVGCWVKMIVDNNVQDTRFVYRTNAKKSKYKQNKIEKKLKDDRMHNFFFLGRRLNSKTRKEKNWITRWLDTRDITRRWKSQSTRHECQQQRSCTIHSEFRMRQDHFMLSSAAPWFYFISFQKKISCILNGGYTITTLTFLRRLRTGMTRASESLFTIEIEV